MAEVGIDTCRFTRYLDSDKELDYTCARAGPGGQLPKLLGRSVGIDRTHRMLHIEGHPAVEGLCRPARLADFEREMLDALDRADLPTGRDGGVRRLDQTVTLRFDRPEEGIAFMYGIAAADLPRSKPAVYGHPPETVYVLGERSGNFLARVYDKGIEAQIAERGQLIRLENQTRYGKKEAMSAETHTDQAISRERFERRFAPMAESLDGIHAASLPVLREHLVEKVKAGEITGRQAERLAGYLLLPDVLPRTTRWRRRRELREQGLVLANPLTDPITVDVGAGVAAALESWSDDEA